MSESLMEKLRQMRLKLEQGGNLSLESTSDFLEWKRQRKEELEFLHWFEDTCDNCLKFDEGLTKWCEECRYREVRVEFEKRYGI